MLMNTAKDESKNNKLFLKLLVENQPKIHAYILTLITSQADADDILQEVCSQLWMRFGEFEQGTNFLSWALRFAFFEVLNFRSRRRRSRQVLFDDDVLQQMIPILDNEMKMADLRMEALEQCLDRLNGRAKDAITMKYNKCLNVIQIADILSLSAQGVYKLLSRTHSQLLSCIQRVIAQEETVHG